MLSSDDMEDFKAWKASRGTRRLQMFKKVTDVRKTTPKKRAVRHAAVASKRALDSGAAESIREHVHAEAWNGEAVLFDTVNGIRDAELMTQDVHRPPGLPPIDAYVLEGSCEVDSLGVTVKSADYCDFGGT